MVNITKIVILLEVSQKVCDSVSINFYSLRGEKFRVQKVSRDLYLRWKKIKKKMEVVETSVVNALRVCPTEKAKLTVLRYLPSASCSSLSAKGMVIFGVLLFLCGFCWVFVWDFLLGFLGGGICLHCWALGWGTDCVSSVFVGFFIWYVVVLDFFIMWGGGRGDHWFGYTISWRAANTSGKINAQNTIQNYTFSRKIYSINTGWKDISWVSKNSSLINRCIFILLRKNLVTR